MIIAQSSAAIAQRDWGPIVKALDTDGYAVVKCMLIPASGKADSGAGSCVR